ncbi:TSSP protease, partial [Amia calva]|nr:TSSP protease [Amia calva]
SLSLSQRYFVNLEFWHRSGGPVFLYIGGEGTLSEYSVLAGHHVSMAAQHSALLVSLEHRYYGQSAASTLDNDQLDTERLSQLSSQQALYDLMLFQQYICRLYGLTSRNTWISFGGSYAGSLSAWLRGKFPHLIYGAVASSAPVKAQLNFTEYNKVVAKSLSNPVVGGSDQCVLAVRQAFSVLDSALRSGRLSSVATDFQSCTALSDPADRRELLSSLAGIAMGAAQYDGQGVPLSIAQVCAIMGNSSSADAYTRLAQLAQAYLQQVGEPCLWSSFQQRLSELQDIRLQPGGVGERQWSYQTCTEFGYYQSCEDPSCPFSPLLTLQAQTQLCPLVFGVSEDRLASAVQFTNSYYGSDSPATYRVLYVNGDVDPWHVLSVLPGSSCCGGRGGGGEGSLALLIPGASHCADMAPPYLTDPPALREARQVSDGERERARETRRERGTRRRVGGE